MKVDILTLCDNAQDYNGKLVIVGAMNEIVVQKVPASIPELAIVARTIIEEEDEDSHEIEITFNSCDMDKTTLFPPFKTVLNTKGNKGKTVYSNVIMRLNNVSLPCTGKYVVKFRIDTIERETLLTVKEAKIVQPKEGEKQ